MKVSVGTPVVTASTGTRKTCNTSCRVSLVQKLSCENTGKEDWVKAQREPVHPSQQNYLKPGVVFYVGSSMTGKNKQTEDVEATNPPKSQKSQESLARERTAYDEAVKHFGVDVAALRHYFPNGRP